MSTPGGALRHVGFTVPPRSCLFEGFTSFATTLICWRGLRIEDRPVNYLERIELRSPRAGIERTEVILGIAVQQQGLAARGSLHGAVRNWVLHGRHRKPEALKAGPYRDRATAESIGDLLDRPAALPQPLHRRIVRARPGLECVRPLFPCPFDMGRDHLTCGLPLLLCPRVRSSSATRGHAGFALRLAQMFPAGHRPFRMPWLLRPISRGTAATRPALRASCAERFAPSAHVGHRSCPHQRTEPPTRVQAGRPPPVSPVAGAVASAWFFEHDTGELRHSQISP